MPNDPLTANAIALPHILPPDFPFPGSPAPAGIARELLILVLHAKKTARELVAAEEKFDAARRGAGFHEAEAEYERLDGELERLWREIAFTPARSLLGVLAKLDAVAETLAAEPLQPADFPDRCAPDDVARMAAVDFATLTSRATPPTDPLNIGAFDRHRAEAGRSDVELLALVAEGRRAWREIAACADLPEHTASLAEANAAYARALAAAMQCTPETGEGLRAQLEWIGFETEGALFPHNLLCAFVRAALASPALGDSDRLKTL